MVYFSLFTINSSLNKILDLNKKLPEATVPQINLSSFGVGTQKKAFLSVKYQKKVRKSALMAKSIEAVDLAVRGV